jgi:hypothetical protein
MGSSMRIMNLPGLHKPLSSADECVRTYSERLGADNAPSPHVSVLLTAYLAWPNNEDRRNSFVASFLARLGVPPEKQPDEPAMEPRADVTVEMFGGIKAITNAALDQLVVEIGQIQRRWLFVADIFQVVVDMAFDKRALLRGGPSISKAIDLCECEHALPGHSQLRGAWSEFRDVAHLLAAGAYLAHEGLAGAGVPHEASVLKAIWIAPDAVLTLAYGLQEFGLEPKPIQKEPSTLNPEGLWRLSDSHKPEKPFIVFRLLSDAQLAFLSTRRASKEYIPSAVALLR